jgi:hypothetical protein
VDKETAKIHFVFVQRATSAQKKRVALGKDQGISHALQVVPNYQGTVEDAGRDRGIASLKHRVKFIYTEKTKWFNDYSLTLRRF